MTAKHPWLARRRDTYYLRAKVPADIRAFYPKAEVKRSLRTQDRATAARLIHIEAALVEKEFGEYRTHHGPAPRPSSIMRYADHYEPKYSGFGPPPRDLTSSEVLTDEDIRRLAFKHFADRRSWIDDPTYGFTADERREYATQLDFEAAENPADDDRNWSDLIELATATLEKNGFFFDRAGSKATKLGEVLFRARNEVMRQRAARLRGEPVATPFDSFFASFSIHETKPNVRGADCDAAGRLSLDQLILRYETDPIRQKISQKTRVEDTRTFSHLREVFKGYRPIAELGQKECQAFRNLICSIPKDAQTVCRGMTAKEAAEEAKARNLPKLSAKGANKYLHKLSALLKYAIDNGLVDGPSPAHKIALPHKHSIDDRDPFSSNQLHSIFSSAKYEEFASCRDGVGSGAGFWVPALALFMGLRQGEACQLMAHDFHRERDVDFIKVQDDCGRRLKTENAKRRVPCHPHLLKLGLLKFVDRAREGGAAGRLFPEEVLGTDGHFSPYSKRFTRSTQDFVP